MPDVLGLPSRLHFLHQCPFIASVAANNAIVAGGMGALNIAGLLKPRFMRLFSKVAFETLLAL
eukprot:4226325-Prymnesium_polylepis.1